MGRARALVLAAAVALALVPGAALAENECEAPGPSGVGTLAGDRKGSAGIYGRVDPREPAGYAGEESNRGYVEAYVTPDGGGIHGSTTGNNALSADVKAGPRAVSVCVAPAGEAIRAP